MFFGFGRVQMRENIVRLIPLVSTFNFIVNSHSVKGTVINIVGNILMFTPYGFLGIIKPKRNNFKNLIIDFLSVIILVEALQYFSRLGVCDIDDVLLNSLGVYLGFKFKKFLFSFLT